MKINKLFIHSYGGKNGLDYVLEINLDFYSKDYDGYYHEFTSGSYIKFSGFNKKQKTKAIELAVENSYKEFLYRMKNNWGYHIKIDENDLNTNSLTDELKIITKNKNFKNGIYYTFNGFRDNMADTVTNFYLERMGGKYENHGFKKLKLVDNLNATNDIWGVCQDKVLYTQVAGIFVPIYENDHGYEISKMINFKKHTHKKTGGLIGSSVLLAGTIGAFALSSPEIWALCLVGSFVAPVIGALIPNFLILDEKYKIDMATGMPTLVKESNFNKAESELIFYIGKFNGQSPDLFMNGKKVGSFQPNSYILVMVPEGKNPAEVCLKSSSDTFCETIPLKVFNTIYYEAKMMNNGQISFKVVKVEAQKKSISERIKQGKLKKGNLYTE